MFIEAFAAFWFAVISVIAIPANVSVIVIIYLKKDVDVLDYYQFLLITQSLRDILLNVLVNFYTVATLVNREIIFSQEYCRLSAYFSRVWYFGTALTLCAVTTERFKSVKQCLNHSQQITTKRLLIVIFVLNVLPILAGLPLALGKTKFLHVTTTYGCMNEKKVLDVHDIEVQITGFLLLLLFLVVPVFFILRTSIRMFLLVKRHKRSIEINQPGKIMPENTTDNVPDERKSYIREKTKQIVDAYLQKVRDVQMAKKVLFINAGFLLSLTPIFILKFYARFHDENLESTPKWFILLVYWVNYCCTIWNPVINLLKKDFRYMFRKMFACFRLSLFGNRTEQ